MKCFQDKHYAPAGRSDLGFNTQSTFRKGSKLKYGKENDVQMFHRANKYYRRQLELKKTLKKFFK